VKKKLLVGAVLAALSISTTAFASPITLSGDGYLQYNNTEQAPGPASGPLSWQPYNGIDARFRLNFDGSIDDNLKAHVRVVHEGDLSTTYAAGEDAGTGYKSTRIDQAYIAGKFDNVNIQVGRDDLFTGKGLIIDDHQFSGVKLSTALNGVTFAGFAGKDISGIKTETADISGAVGSVNLGANVVRFGDTHFYGINADTKVGDAVLSAEYVKNTTTEAKGYIAGVTMGNYTVSYRDIEDGAVTPYHTTNLNYNDSKGFKLAAHYGVTKNSSITLYQDFAQNQAGVDKQRTNIEYDFNF
jgi:hypothetical protein